MENTGDAHQRRRRRGVFGAGSMSNATDGAHHAPEVEEDIADTIVDINRLVEQKTSEGEDAVPETNLDVYDKETRLRFIHKLKMRDIPKAEICKRLGITSAKLENDTKELYSRLREGARKLDVNVIIGDTIATYNEVLSMALNHASNTKLPTPTRLAALRTVLSAKNDMARFMNLAGVFDTLVYKPQEASTETDIGQLIKVTQAILDKDEVSTHPEITEHQRISTETELQEIRLF